MCQYALAQCPAVPHPGESLKANTNIFYGLHCHRKWNDENYAGGSPSIYSEIVTYDRGIH